MVDDAGDANDMDATRIQKIPSKGNNTGRQVATTTTAPTKPAASTTAKTQHNPRRNVPASFIREAVAQRPHVVAYRGPFRAADDANVLNRQDGKEEVLVGPVVPVLVHGCWAAALRRASADQLYKRARRKSG